jgi:Tfp pilus assembly protein PilZ
VCLKNAFNAVRVVVLFLNTAPVVVMAWQMAWVKPVRIKYRCDGFVVVFYA